MGAVFALGRMDRNLLNPLPMLARPNGSWLPSGYYTEDMPQYRLDGPGALRMHLRRQPMVFNSIMFSQTRARLL